MTLKLKCPCGKRFTAPESAAGKGGRCSKCGRSFIIPSPKQIAPSLPKSSRPNEDVDDEFDFPTLDNVLGDLLDEALSEPNSAAFHPTAKSQVATLEASKHGICIPAEVPRLNDEDRTRRKWVFFFGVVFTALGLYSIATGSAWMLFRLVNKGVSRESWEITHTSDPTVYWGIISAELILGILMIMASSISYLWAIRPNK